MIGSVRINPIVDESQCGEPPGQDSALRFAAILFRRLLGGPSVEAAGKATGPSGSMAYRNWKYALDWLREILSK